AVDLAPHLQAVAEPGRREELGTAGDPWQAAEIRPGGEVDERETGRFHQPVSPLVHPYVILRIEDDAPRVAVRPLDPNALHGSQHPCSFATRVHRLAGRPDLSRPLDRVKGPA